MFRFKRYDEGLLAESLARFGWEKLVCLPIGESDRAPMAMLLVKRLTTAAAFEATFQHDDTAAQIWIESTARSDLTIPSVVMPPVNQAHFGDIHIEGQGQLTINRSCRFLSQR